MIILLKFLCNSNFSEKLKRYWKCVKLKLQTTDTEVNKLTLIFLSIF